MMPLPSPTSVRDAHDRIRGLVHHTPVLRCRSIERELGAAVFFKCEHLQRAGAFKFRGASHVLSLLGEEERKRGVATHSSGNHGAALALAASLRSIPCTVVMPEDASPVKRDAVLRHGASIVSCAPTTEARVDGLRAIVAKSGAVPVHPYDDARIVAGQGTAALELLEDVEGLDRLVVPVGGGGLLGGTLLAAQLAPRHLRVAAIEPAGADDAYRSHRARAHLRGTPPRTIADGLRAPLGALNYALMERYVDEVCTVEDAAIVRAMRLVWERMKQTIEPSAAVAVAGLIEHRASIGGERIGLILSGGNVDLDHLPFASVGEAGGPAPSS